MMTFKSGCVFLLLLLVSSALGEVQLVCPPSATRNPQYTELTPGPKTIVFRQTDAREGTPFRLSIYRQNQECVILDHIPYQASNSMYYVTIDIPDVSCPRSQNCRLVLQQIDASTYGYCQLSSCMRYNSTAPISIRSSITNSFSCPSRRRPFRNYNWPYDPSRLYTSTLTSTSSSARANGMFIIVGQSLLYNVTLTTPFSDSSQAQSLQFFYYLPSNATMTMTTITFVANRNWTAGSWTGLTSFAKNLVTTGSLYIRMTSTTDGRGITGPISPTANAAARDNFYGYEYGRYSSTGWLTGGIFVGSTANATFFAKPTGSCINSTRFFGCMLTSQVENGGGTVGVAITGTRIVFGMDMYNVSSAIRRVWLKGPAVDSLDLTPYWNNGYHLDGVADVSEDQQSRLIAGLSSIEISTNRGTGELKCDLEEGIISLLDSNLEKPSIATSTNGTATLFLYFSVDGTITLQTTANSLTSPLAKAHLHAPAYQGITTSSIPFDLSSYIAGQNGSSWNIMAKLRNISSSELRYFIEGLYYVNLHTIDNPLGELRGQVSIPGSWLCPSTGTLINQCTFVWLWPVDDALMVNTSIQSYGVGAAVIDRVLRLQYSVSFWNVPSGMDLTINLVTSDGTILQTVTNTQTSNRANVQEINMVYPATYNQDLSQSVLSLAASGSLALNVTTPNFPGGYMYGMLPSIQRNKCTQQPYVIPVGTTNGTSTGWTQNQRYLPIRLSKGDILNFNFTSPDNVYLMENQNRYTGCIFGTATLLSGTTGQYNYTATTVGNYYFASDSDCDDNNNPMKFPAYVVENVDKTMDSETCTQSLYAYTAEQRYGTSASTGTLGATVAGLVFGLAVVVIVIVAVVVVLVKGRTSKESVDLPAAKA